MPPQSSGRWSMSRKVCPIVATRTSLPRFSTHDPAILLSKIRSSRPRTRAGCPTIGNGKASASSSPKASCPVSPKLSGSRLAVRARQQQGPRTSIGESPPLHGGEVGDVACRVDETDSVFRWKVRDAQHPNGASSIIRIRADHACVSKARFQAGVVALARRVAPQIEPLAGRLAIHPPYEPEELERREHRLAALLEQPGQMAACTGQSSSSGMKP